MEEIENEFDWKFYISKYNDLREAGILTKDKALWHWNFYGKKENRICNKEMLIKLTKKINQNKSTRTSTTVSGKKISIVMAYYNRKILLLKTLVGFQKTYAGKYNFEVVIVDDNSNDDNKLNEVIKQFSFPINLIVISQEEKGCDRYNGCVAYNRGFKEATGEIIIIQNPECYHVGDILSHTLENLNEQDYFTYSCFSPNNFPLTDELMNCDNKYDLVHNEDFLKRNKITKEIFTWYNHPKYHKRYFHWCSAIFKNKLDLIGGFDERFADGFCYDDDEFLLAIKYNLKLNIKIIEPEVGFVIHQHHGVSVYNDTKFLEKEKKNKILYDYIKYNHEKNNFSYPKLLFLYWDRSPLSYLNYITIASFNFYNPCWKIIIYVPSKITKTISWSTNEQKIKYSGQDYFYKLQEFNNVVVKPICLDTIGFYNSASEVIKSDYFRYYIMEKHGGVWSDFDIIYTGSIEEKMNFTENNIIFKCSGFARPKDKTSHRYTYYPIGLFLCKPKSKLFKFIKELCTDNYDPLNYQSIGASMFKNTFNSIDIHSIDNVRICNEDYYLPWHAIELYEFLDLEYINNKLPSNNVGIHWFNGADKSKQFSIDLDKRLHNFTITCYLDYHMQKYLPKKCIYITNKQEFSTGYGQYFRIHRLNSLNNDNRYDVFDITDDFCDKQLQNYSSLITTHDCLDIKLEKGDEIIDFNNSDPYAANFVKLFFRDIKKQSNIIVEDNKTIINEPVSHWCSHYCCGCIDKNFVICKNNLLTYMLSAVKKKFLIIEDMHEYTFAGNLENFCKHIDTRYNFIIYHYENSLELKQIKTYCKNIKGFFCLPHHVNTSVFKNYNVDKKYDVLLYGSVYDKIYTLRHKIKNALINSDINYKIIDPPDWKSLDFSNEILSKHINSAYITIATGSIFEYAVSKYFEIGASYSVVAGDQPKPIDSIFEDNMIKLNNNMSEKEILNILKNALQNKNKLLEMSKIMYRKIHNNFNMTEYNNKLYNIIHNASTK